eukprot:6052333-Pleurochrysis_carterae.AAC.2
MLRIGLAATRCGRSCGTRREARASRRTASTPARRRAARRISDDAHYSVRTCESWPAQADRLSASRRRLVLGSGEVCDGTLTAWRAYLMSFSRAFR